MWERWRQGDSLQTIAPFCITKLQVQRIRQHGVTIGHVRGGAGTRTLHHDAGLVDYGAHVLVAVIVGVFLVLRHRESVVDIAEQRFAPGKVDFHDGGVVIGGNLATWRSCSASLVSTRCMTRGRPADWIKMRSNLLTDQRVAMMCDLTGCAGPMVIGGLFWLWTTVDQHIEDGSCRGRPPRLTASAAWPGWARRFWRSAGSSG